MDLWGLFLFSYVREWVIWKKSLGLERSLSGRRDYRNGYTETSTSQPAWFLWQLRSTAFSMTRCRQQTLESKQHSLCCGEVIVLVVVTTATACLCQTNHHNACLLGLSGVRWTRSCEQKDRSKCPAGGFSSMFHCIEGSPLPASATADSWNTSIKGRKSACCAPTAGRCLFKQSKSPSMFHLGC